MITPNGRFKPNENICMSFTKFHPESWSPLWTIEMMLLGLISFMLEDQSTTGSIVTTNHHKIILAKNSMQFNITQKSFNSHFKSHINKLYSSLKLSENNHISTT